MTREKNLKHRHYHYAGFNERMVASIIDSLLVMMLTLPILIHLYGWQYLLPTLGIDQGIKLIHGPTDFILSYLLPSVVIIIFWLYRSATPGKMLMNIVIIDARTGTPPSKSQCLLRYLYYYISLLPLGLGFFWIIVDHKKRGFHDMLAKTYVIHQNT